MGKDMNNLKMYIFRRDVWKKTKGLRMYRRKQKRIRVMNKFMSVVNKSDK